MRTQVLALEVVLAGGTVLRTGSRAIKTSAGHNLTTLFVGSEGTLGVITELVLRLYGIPEYTVAARASFPDLDAAVRAAVTMIGAGVAVTRVELLDALTLRAVNAYKQTAYEEAPIGHVGDGNYHLGFMVDPGDPESICAAEEVNHEIVEYALVRGGTCTGEHGIGLGKIGYLEREHADLIGVMRGVKALLDPNGILNPGKVLPPE